MLGLLDKQKRKNSTSYPKQFWLLFWGVFINRISASMIWPFLTIYIYTTFDVPLLIATLLLPVRAITSIISTAIISPIMDTFGRKWVMVIGLIASTFVFAGMAFGSTIWMWVILIGAHGAVIPIFNTGVQTMVADMIPQSNRAPAYALIRMISNAGIAIGPVIGGILAVMSFTLIFLSTAFVYVLLAILVFLFISETMPTIAVEQNDTTSSSKGYGFVLRDIPFMQFILFFFVLVMAYSQVFSLIPVYVSENFGLREAQYSLIFSLNAAIVVLFQYKVTKFTDRYRPYPVITIGAAFYMVGLLSIALGDTLIHFLLSMAIITTGELIIMPTASTLVANLAPDNMRARYMGLLSLGYPVGSGIGPVIGGYLNDAVAPVAIWYGAGTLALIGTIGFAFLATQQRRQALKAL